MIAPSYTKWMIKDTISQSKYDLFMFMKSQW